MTTPEGWAAGEAVGADPELPGMGRVVTGQCRVRMSDAGPDRRARLDALARYLQDVAEDDGASASLPPAVGWVLRRTRMEIDRFPTLGEDLVLHTFCSGTASRWAERTTLARGAAGARIRAVSIWVAVDTGTGASTRLDDSFFAVYGPSANGRHASARLVLGAPGEAAASSARPWPLRRSDFDSWSHVNNSIAWAAVEDAVEIGAADSVDALLEHHVPIGPGTEPLLASGHDGKEWSAWLLEPGERRRVLAASRVEINHGGRGD